MKRLKIWMTALLAAVVVCTGCCPAHAAEKTDAVTGKTQIRVGCTEMNGFLKRNVNGSFSGFAYDILKELSMYMGSDFEITAASHTDCLQMLEEGKLDLVIPMEMTEGSAQNYALSDMPFCSSTAVLITQPDSDYWFNDFENFGGMTIGIVKDCPDNARLQELLRTHNCLVTFQQYPTTEALRQALKSKKINAAFTGSSRELSDCKVIAQLPKVNFYAAAAKTNHALIESINCALKQIELNTPEFCSSLDKTYLAAGTNMKPAFTRQEKNFIASQPELTAVVGIGDSDLIENGQMSSFTQFATLLQNLSGLKIKLEKASTLPDAYTAMENGQANLIFPFCRDTTWAESHNVWLTQSFLSMGNYRICKSPTQEVKSIAVQQGSYAAFQLLAAHDKTIIPCNTNAEAVNKVQCGQADATICDRFTGSYFATHAGYRLTFLIDSSPEQQYSIGISRQSNPTLLSVFNKTLNCIQPPRIESIFSTMASKKPLTLSDHFQMEPELCIAICLAIAVSILILILMAVSNSLVKKKNLQLENASHAKSDFLARMSHDLRTPMNAIMGLAHLGTEEKDLNTNRDYFNKILSSGTYLLSLINDILDMSKIENRKVELHPEDVNIAEFLRTIETIMRPSITEKDIDFIVEQKGISVCCLRFDRLHMQQIILNLLSNAVKFSRKGGRVRLTIRCQQGKGQKVNVCFEVQDYGIGMSDTYLERIFVPFEQEHNQQLPEQTGTGLGLAIVKKLTDLMGGRITVKSELGKGTIFQLLFVLKKVAQSQEQEDLQPTLKAPGSLCGLHILLAEDHPLNIEIACKLLENQGMLTDCAHSGKEAVQMFQDSKPGTYAAVLMDIRMPVMDGLEATRKIRSLDRPDAKSIPILAMSANAFTEDVQQSLDAGMNAHLAKPIDPQKLYSELEKWTSVSSK
ncbi:MAG: transporter substrate-binding domain-containing protein [Oscillospiraceae bacterium]|jgi:signal transduction histidine kinase/ABC-type amino acid transport substrate-binding protein/ActR/RegA family two-component response regulator|nr:transporter substrate-binding domain-containing protein [Oscillospiraceae bacterium]